VTPWQHRSRGPVRAASLASIAIIFAACNTAGAESVHDVGRSRKRGHIRGCVDRDRFIRAGRRPDRLR